MIQSNVQGSGHVAGMRIFFPEMNVAEREFKQNDPLLEIKTAFFGDDHDDNRNRNDYVKIEPMVNNLSHVIASFP